MSIENMTPDEMMAAMMSEHTAPESEAKPVASAGPVAVQAATKETAVVSTPLVQPTTPTSDSNRGDVSASTIARMMGMATAAEFRVLEGKVDLLSTKFNSITGKLERIASALANVSTGSDLERIDVQISSLRTALNESVAKMDASLDGAVQKLVQASAAKNQKDGE